MAPCAEGHRLAYDVCFDLGISSMFTNCLDHCDGELHDCESDGTYSDHATPGMTVGHEHGPEWLARPLADQRRRYAPWVVSPHLFGGGS